MTLPEQIFFLQLIGVFMEASFRTFHTSGFPKSLTLKNLEQATCVAPVAHSGFLGAQEA